MTENRQPPEIHFVISAPRSGSTWLTRALNEHPEIFATEHRLFGEFCEIWPNNDGSRSPRITMDEFANAFGVHYFFSELGLDRQDFVREFQRTLHDALLRFAASRKQCSLLIDKVTPYPGTASMVLQKIREFFPNARVLHLIRDGRDMAVSAAFDWLLKDGHGSERYRHYVEREESSKMTRFFDDKEVKRWAELWSEVNSELANENAGQFQIRYEDMKSNLAAQLVRVFRFLKVSDEPRIAESCAESTSFKKLTGRKAGSAEPTAKTRKGVVGDWKNYFTRDDAELFDEIAGNNLEFFGYSKGGEWVNECPIQMDAQLQARS